MNKWPPDGPVKILDPLPGMTVYDPNTESSVSIEIIRGERVIRVHEALHGDDLMSESETKAVIRRLVDAVLQTL